MRDVKRGALTAAVGAVVIALAGCGAVDSVRYPYAKESPERIWSDAVKATSAVSSLRVSGFRDPDKGPRTNFSLLNAESGRCGGTMSFSTADFDLVISDADTYLMGSASSWQQLPGMSREQGIVLGPVLADRWVQADKEAGEFVGPFCGFVDEILKGDREGTGEIQVNNRGLTEAAGVKTVRLEADDDKRSIDVWVDVEEPHYIVKMVVTEKKGSTEVVLSDFNFGGEVDRPKKKDILDPATLSAEDFGKRSG